MKTPIHTIIFLAGSSAGNKAHLVQTKVREIDEHLNKGTNRDDFNFLKELAVGSHNLQQIFLELKAKYRPPYIIHFNAEVTEDGNIALMNKTGSRQIVSGRALVELLKIFKDDICAVIFDGGKAEKLGRQLQGSIAYLISMNGDIDGESTITFWASFYQGLSYGTDVELSFELGKSQMQLEDNPDYNKPKLHKYLTKTRKICGASTV